MTSVHLYISFLNSAAEICLKCTVECADKHYGKLKQYLM